MNRPRQRQQLVPVSAAHVGSGVEYRRAAGALGDPQNPPTAPAPGTIRHATDEDFENYDQVPSWYTVSVDLGGEANARQANSTPLRPERFVLRRITWATCADTPLGGCVAPGSIHGKCVEIIWEDEFTKFMGQQPGLLSAVFGDSNGFLDLPGKGLLFQGRQSLQVELRRIIWPVTTPEPATFRFDVMFHGFGLLPKNARGVSGSV